MLNFLDTQMSFESLDKKLKMIYMLVEYLETSGNIRLIKQQCARYSQNKVSLISHLSICCSVCQLVRQYDIVYNPLSNLGQLVHVSREISTWWNLRNNIHNWNWNSMEIQVFFFFWLIDVKCQSFHALIQDKNREARARKTPFWPQIITYQILVVNVSYLLDWRILT